MICINFVKITSSTSRVPIGRCKFYNQVVEQSGCQKKEGQHVKCFKCEFPQKTNE